MRAPLELYRKLVSIYLSMGNEVSPAWQPGRQFSNAMVLYLQRDYQ